MDSSFQARSRLFDDDRRFEAIRASKLNKPHSDDPGEVPGFTEPRITGFTGPRLAACGGP
jgi:hypothetical protein